jgi:hypothetical protein
MGGGWDLFMNRLDRLHNGGGVPVISSGVYTESEASLKDPWPLQPLLPCQPTKPDGSNPSTFLWVDKRKASGYGKAIQALL